MGIEPTSDSDCRSTVLKDVEMAASPQVSRLHRGHRLPIPPLSRAAAALPDGARAAAGPGPGAAYQARWHAGWRRGSGVIAPVRELLTVRAMSAPTNDGGNWLTVKDILDDLGIARSTFDTWRLLGTGPRTVKLPNKQLRIRRDWYAEWLRSLEDGAA